MNESPTDRLIRELKEENARLLALLQGRPQTGPRAATSAIGVEADFGTVLTISRLVANGKLVYCTRLFVVNVCIGLMLVRPLVVHKHLGAMYLYSIEYSTTM